MIVPKKGAFFVFIRILAEVPPSEAQDVTERFSYKWREGSDGWETLAKCDIVYRWW